MYDGTEQNLKKNNLMQTRDKKYNNPKFVDRCIGNKKCYI